jgi:hypothetical protein
MPDGLFSACKSPNAKSGKAQEEEVQELQELQNVGMRRRNSGVIETDGHLRGEQGRTPIPFPILQLLNFFLKDISL